MIRPETAADIQAIHDLTVQAFLGAPHTSHTEHLIVQALRDTEALSLSLVAEHQGEVIGHIAVSPVTISDGSRSWHGLGPISVWPTHQRRGIGSALVRSAIGHLRASHSSGCVLVGDPLFYSRFGFRPSTDLVLPDMPAEYFQIIYFDSSRPCGTVTFHHAFNSTKG